MNEPHPAADHCSGITSREDKMSKEAITKVVQRAISDAGFRRQLSTDPTGALRGFDLSADEAAALRAGDAGRLSALGVDQRMSKAFALGGAAAAATRPGSTDLNASGLNAGGSNALSNADATGAAGSMRSALVSSNDANAAMIDDGSTGARTIIPTEPQGSTSADLDGSASVRGSAINDDPDGFLAANAKASGGMANYPAHGGLAGPSSVESARAGDDWARAGSAQAGDTGASAARSSAINDDPDGFLAANKNADFSGGTAAGETAFVDESEAYLTKVGYDPNAATAAVTDAHDRGDGAGISAVTDAHDRGDVTRIDDDAEGGTSAASEHGPNISS
jgi:hypothetical protein